jgi:hypothetical protein
VQGLAVQVSRVLTRRRHQRARGERRIGARKQALESLVIVRGGCVRRRRPRRRFRRCMQRSPQERCCERQGDGEKEPRRRAPAPRCYRARRGVGPGSALRVAPPGRLDEQAHPLLRERPVQKAMHRTVGDLCGEHALLVGASGDDEHQIGELGMQATDEIARGGRERRGVDDGHACLVSQERARKIDLGADRQHLMRGVGDFLQDCNELGVAREGDERRRHESQTQPRDPQGRCRPGVTCWDLGGHDCHNPENPPVGPPCPAAGLR